MEFRLALPIPPIISKHLAEAVSILPDRYSVIIIAGISKPKSKPERDNTDVCHLRRNEVTFSSLVISELNQAPLKWEQVYDTVRPHQALGYLTPHQFLTRHQQNQKKEVSCH